MVTRNTSASELCGLRLLVTTILLLENKQKNSFYSVLNVGHFSLKRCRFRMPRSFQDRNDGPFVLRFDSWLKNVPSLWIWIVKRACRRQMMMVLKSNDERGWPVPFGWLLAAAVCSLRRCQTYNFPQRPFGHGTETPDRFSFFFFLFLIVQKLISFLYFIFYFFFPVLLSFLFVSLSLFNSRTGCGRRWRLRRRTSSLPFRVVLVPRFISFRLFFFCVVVVDRIYLERRRNVHVVPSPPSFFSAAKTHPLFACFHRRLPQWLRIV